MASVPFAVSVHHFISSVGADAGFAAIIGLAILVFLYFAQARETAALRDRAEESAERVQQLETRVAQLSGSAGATSSTTAPAGPAPPGARSPATPGRASRGPALRFVSAAAGRAGIAAWHRLGQRRLAFLPWVHRPGGTAGGGRGGCGGVDRDLGRRLLEQRLERERGQRLAAHT